ncbi:MAG: tetratricopeptide repeat protein [Bacteroidales bacterium]|nr:tetratricopeptide repeat protein [Bacteroidales bacterium]
MKRLLYFVVFLLVALCGQSQTINQKGVTYRYNGKNKRTPIGGVYIKAVTANNGEVSNEKTGAFELTLNNLRMGSRIGNVRVTKQGMMVFNQQAVDEWSVRKDPLCLILCDADEFQRQKKNLIAIGERQAQKKYEKKLAELNKLNDAKQLQIDDYYNKLDSLEKEYQNALKHMDEYADVFARIDESEVDTVTQRAIELFHRGEIEESLRMLEGQNYMEKIGKALRTIQQADAMISTFEQAKSLAEQDLEQYLEGMKTQIAGNKLQNEWVKAAALLKGLADTLQTKEAIGEYAYFAINQKMYKEAEAYYLKYKEILERLVQANPQAYEPYLAYSYNNLANIFSDTQRFSESEAMHKQALAIRERLAQSNPQAYEPDLAMSYNNLANLYKRTQRFSESEAMHKQALAIRERLAQSNPQAYEPDLAMFYYNLAYLYSSTQRFTESEAMYKQALAIYERLAQSNPQAYEPDLAGSYNNLANLYSDIQRFAESEAMYQQALEIYERLAQSYPQAYEPDLAASYNNLALLYSDTQRFTESEAMHKHALAIYERLAQANHQVYETQLMRTYFWLGQTMLLDGKNHEAQEPFQKSLHLARNLVRAGAETSLYWESLYCLSLISANEKDYASAYTYNEELLPLMNAMYKDDAEGWKADYLLQLVRQSFCANLLGKFNEGEHYSLEAIKVDSTQHIAYANLAAALLFQGKVEEAEKLYRQYKAELKEGFLDAFAEFERLNVIPEERKKDVERIKAMLKE